jgi:hypothetical protein
MLNYFTYLHSKNERATHFYMTSPYADDFNFVEIVAQWKMDGKMSK